ncbi:cytochrome P450 [Kitasatospora sp. NPDC056138]|uniref:cytochrome P450 n=1 Tax=Kitasatospora sp. NPDC056138 TaxID=3345724 RepID=UPI0035DF1C0A
MAETNEIAPSYPIPRATGCPLDPPPLLGELREQRAVSPVTLWDGRTAWLVTRLEDVRRLLRDSRLSADVRNPSYPFLSEGQVATRELLESFIRTDPPEHDRQRRMLTAEFRVKQIESMRPGVQRIVDRLLDDMIAAGSPADFVTAFALPLPSLVICQLLGVPYSDHDFFQRCTAVAFNRNSTAEQIRTSREQLTDYLGRLVASKAERPTDDLLSRMVLNQELPGHLTREQVVKTAILLLVGGHETTANMTALSVFDLLRHPEQSELLRERPELIPGAVEELLRVHTVAHNGLPRVAVEDIEVDGTTIPAGDAVLLSLAAANHDPRAFDAPDRLDVERNSRGHVAFGFGVHQCLGQPLARLELQIALDTILRRLPGLRLVNDSLEDLDCRHSMTIFGLHSLPVAW